MEDLSVDTSNLEREEILAKLGQTSSLQGSAKLKIALKNFLIKNHPIYEFLGELTNNDLRTASNIILKKTGNSDFTGIRKALANDMFKKFRRAPLTSLAWILENGKMPNETDFDLILKNFPFSKIRQFPLNSEKKKTQKRKENTKIESEDTKPTAKKSKNE